MKAAMRAREAETVSTVRMILAGIKDKEYPRPPVGQRHGHR